jgi:hypothetical protein
MTENIIQFFNNLPATSQSAIIASVVTVLGVIFSAVFTHLGNERRFAKQLKHDRLQKRVDREMELRKEVYLNAAEAIDAGLVVINNYANLGKTPEELFKEFSEKRSAFSKMHLIARESTVASIQALGLEFDEAVKRLSLLRQPLTQMQAQLKLLNDQIHASGRERDRMVELMKQLNFEGNKDAHRWDFVRNTFEFEQQRVSKAIEEQMILDARLKADWAIFATECFSAANKISGLIAPAVKAVRDELELSFDYTSYKTTIDESLKRQHESMKIYLDELLKPKG